MSWLDRLQEAALTPAGGTRQVFQYVDVSQNVDLRGTAFEFPDADGTYVQRLGRSGRRYPMRVYLSGENYDLAANAFVAALETPGIMVLEHPIYGTLNVVPFGAVRRNDALTTEANQAVIEVTFWDTIDTVYPTSQTDPASTVAAAVGAFNAAAAEEFEDALDLSSPTASAEFQARFQALLDGSRAILGPVTEGTDSVERQFNAIYDSINQGLSVLIGEPLTLAFQTVLLVEAPGRATSAITDRLQAYQSLADSMFGTDTTESNDFHGADLYASSSVAGAVTSVVNNQFETRTGALEAAEAILDLNEQVTNWRDQNYEQLGEIDTGGQYQAMQEAAALAAGFLVQISFNLKQERRLVLTRARTIVDLVAELSGRVDEELDFFIDSNDLAWDETLELKAGREVVYYV